jgi:hypothetical protein
MAQVKQGRVVTASGQSQSSAFALGTETLVGLYTPAALDAAQLKIQASHDGASFVDVMDEGAAVTVSADENAYIALSAAKFLGAARLRFVHVDGGGAPVAESAERVLRPVFRTFE